MRIGPEYFIRVIQLLDHRTPLVCSMRCNNTVFPVFALQVHAHANGIGFGVELGADHVFVKTNAHNSSFQWYVRSFFFYTKHRCPHLFEPAAVGDRYLVVAAVNSIERVVQPVKHDFLFSFI